jgi:glutamyl-tRNA reductase
MPLFTLGLNHTTAPLEVREKVVFEPELLSDALRDLTSAGHATEAAILSTCNRTEVYFEGGDSKAVAEWLAEVHGLPAATLLPYVYTLQRDKTVTHAFRVASGLDSMVLGEPQILGQMKHAVRAAETAGTLGFVLNRLFQRTFAVAKDVRTQTDLGSASISMAAAAVKLAERIFHSISGQRLLLVGAGEMIELAAKHFLAKGPHSMTVANRTLGRGRDLASRLGAEAITLNELPGRLPDFDIIVTCTASQRPIIGKALLERVIRKRKHAPVLIVDLGVPRDVEAEAADFDDVFLYSIDNLQAIVQENLQIRREAVAHAERMIADQTAHFLRWLEGRSAVSTIDALSRQHDEVRVAELDRARRMLAAGAAPGAVLESLAHGLTRKFLHAPLAALNAASDSERAELVAAITRVYHLDATVQHEWARQRLTA